MALIACRDVALGYDTGIVVEGLNFAVEAGDSLCVVGENGSGKSTLIKGLLRLISPLRGEIVLGDGLLPSDIGYLPQQTAVQKDFPASVTEVVLSGRQNSRGLRPFYGKADKAAALESMERLDIVPLKNACYRELSGGQQQRVRLARALCAAQRLLLLDEPVAGLDPAATQELYDIIGKLRGDGLTIVMVSHDMRGAIRHASHILHLRQTQAFFGPTADYLRTPLAKMFLGEEIA